jgi:hypothetical protein
MMRDLDGRRVGGRLIFGCSALSFGAERYEKRCTTPLTTVVHFKNSPRLMRGAKAGKQMTVRRNPGRQE